MGARELKQVILVVICFTFSVCNSVQMQETPPKEKVEQYKDLFVIIVNDKRGFIDRNGQVVIEPQFQGANDFIEGRGLVLTKNGKYGFIDENGRFIIEPKFDSVGNFSESLAAVGVGEFGIHGGGNHQWGFIDKSGKTVIEPRFREAAGFSEGFAVVGDDDGKYGYIDKAGNVVIPSQFNDAFSFSEDLACVKIGQKFGFINKSGKVVIEPIFSLPSRFKEGLAPVIIGETAFKYYGQYLIKSGTASLIDKTGKVISKIGDNVKSVNSFSDGLALITVIKKNGIPYYGYIDRTGKTVIEPQFQTFANDFSEGLALVSINDKMCFINKTGKVVINTDYSFANNFRNGLAWVEKGKSAGDFKNAKYGYIDKTGKVIWQFTK